MFYKIVADNCLFVIKKYTSLFVFYFPFRCMTNLGQDWSYCDRIEHSFSMC